MDLASELNFYINDVRHKVSVDKLSPTITLNSFLRDQLQLTGTKKMCEEGGCGVCTVVRKIDNKQEFIAINSCLVSLLSCQGWNIYTVEGLGNSSQRHVIQERLIKFNGSQCGFCTPGMVMNMYALQQSNSKLKIGDVENSFAGNICRCTGYRSILAACKSLCIDATPELKACITDIEDVQPCNGPRNNAIETLSKAPFHFLFPKATWIKVYEFTDLLEILKTFQGSQICKIIAGNTAKGVYKHKTVANVYVDIANIAELRHHKINENFLLLGANVTLADAMKTFRRLSMSKKEFEYLSRVADHIDLVATVPIRNIGTIAGNLMIKHQHNDFPSDIFLLLETCNAKLTIVDTSGSSYLKTPHEFLKFDMTNKIIKEILLPKLNPLEYKFGSYKIMPRSQNAHALQNAGFLIRFNNDMLILSARLIFGHVNAHFIHASKTEQFLKTKNIFNNTNLQEAFKILNSELICDHIPPEPHPDFRKNLAISLFYKFILSIAPKHLISKRHLSGRDLLIRPISNTVHDYDTKECIYPLARGISKVEAKYQVTGEAEYIMDMPSVKGQLFAAFVLSKIRPGSEIVSINTQKALDLDGVEAFFDKNSIPGKNTFTPIEGAVFEQPTEEELFSSGTIKYFSQPIGIIVASSHEIAQEAAELVEITYKLSTEKPLLSIIDVLTRGDTTRIVQEHIEEPTKKGALNNTRQISGSFNVSWQYHYHLETQCCSAIPKEDGIDLYPASQWMDLTQCAVAAVLNIPANRINISVKRLGGAFGGKIMRNGQIAAATALACHLLKKPVKMWLPFETNISAIGKRYPVSSKYKAHVDSNGIIQSLDNQIYYDHGNGNNEQIVFFMREVYMETYDSSTWRTDTGIVFTDTPASCYTRAPGTAEGILLIESIMEQIAMEIGMDPLELKLKNLNNKHPKLLEHINDFLNWADIFERKLQINKFNEENKWRKKGLSVVPMAYPFPMVFGYGAIVSIYHVDGSVAVAHGGVEMGQGINTKVVEACAFKLGIPVEKIAVKASNNLIAPNASMSGASITSESVCWGVMKACDILLERMAPIKKTLSPNASWEEIVKQCQTEFVNLCASSMMQGPKEKDLQQYYVYGVCASEIELDVLTGQYQVTRVDLLEDTGDSMNPAIDIGQIEGAFIMGLGYFCTEEIILSEEGETLTNRTWNYKPPGAKDIPVDFRVKFPKNCPNAVGVLKSKAVGEPPLCLAASIPLAIKQAVAPARSEFAPSASKWYPIDGPCTVENTYRNCLHQFKHFTL
ncbi:unnamed protein product [Ceutorhynchus assimilis]|uniref:Indole-3-acetaldehyde oxidase n=1 Tax=Ceutorhynchus assimilis TaxID=467358 RepID=A0A9N9MR00_9CUCU|nr:unnamed protein product [Ceutorhynchus assimilis]